MLAALLFCAALGVYICTLCPTLYWGDCGELAAAAVTLGIPHPTGYPVWTMLAKAWSLLVPLGTLLWRLNLLSALFGALAVVAVFGAARALGQPRPIAWTAAGVFAFSDTFWQQCTFAETYSLTACSTALLLFLALRWRARGCPLAGLRSLALMYGLALTNGQINALFLPGFFLFIFLSAPQWGAIRSPQVRQEWLRLSGLLLLPLLSYAYLPLRALAHPAINWGDPRTPFAFFYHVTGRTYVPLMFHQPLAQVKYFAVSWISNLSGEYAWPLVALAVLGLGVLLRSARPVAVLLAWIALADITFALNYAIYNRYIYFIPCYIVLALLLGVGIDALRRGLMSRIVPEKQALFQALGAACLLLVVPLQAVAHWQRNDLHRTWACYDYGHNLLASVPAGGVLIDNGQDTGHAAMLYLQNVEHFRPDVVVVQRQLLAGLYDTRYRRWTNRWYWNALRRQYPSLEALYPSPGPTPQQTWTEDVLRRLITQAVAAKRPVVVLRPDDPIAIDDGQGRFVRLNQYLASHYDLAQVGLLTGVYPQGRRPSRPALFAQTQAIWKQYGLRGLTADLYQQDTFLAPIAVDYADAGLVRARLAYAQGDYAEAEEAYRFVLRLFQSDEAANGLAQCAQARRQRLALAGLPAP